MLLKRTDIIFIIWIAIMINQDFWRDQDFWILLLVNYIRWLIMSSEFKRLKDFNLRQIFLLVLKISHVDNRKIIKNI